jgi:radical SAM superfamily enzyme YgiQ (UPF0313 family)
MPSRILLVSFNRYKQPFPVYPLGLTYVADALSAAGHQVLFVDLNIDEADWVEKARTFHPQLTGIAIRNVDEVMIGETDTLLGGLESVVAKCREISSGPVIIGGTAVSLFPREILEFSGADYAVRGEGERAFAELATSVEKGEEPSAPWLLKRGETHLPTPAPSTFCTRYNEAVREQIAPYYIETSGMLNIQTQRGCPLRCCYCTYPSIEGRAVRRKEVDAVIEELQLVKRMGARYFFLVDGVFNTSNNYVTRLCEAMIRANLDLSWCAFLRPSNINRDLALLMARAGLAHAECGSDTLSPRMLKSFGKNFTLEAALEATRNLNEAHIKTCHYIIFGGPGENEETVRETFEHSRELPDSVFMSSVGIRVYPRTALYESLVKENPEFARKSLLKPCYYLSPAFTEASLHTLIQGLAKGRSEWIVPPAPPGLDEEMNRLRKKGILGPLWDYMELMQRFNRAG